MAGSSCQELTRGRWLAGLPSPKPPSQPTGRWFEPKKAKVVSQLLPCFLPSACQIPARFLLLLFLAPSFSSLCHLLSQTPELASRSPQLNRLPFCSPEEPSGNILAQSQDTLGSKLTRKPWGSQGHDLGAAPSLLCLIPTSPQLVGSLPMFLTPCL